MPLFRDCSPEKQRELEAGRARMEAMKVKVEIYPAYPVPERPEPPREQVIVHRHSDMSQQDYRLLQQAVLRLSYLDKKLTEHIQYKKPRGKY